MVKTIRWKKLEKKYDSQLMRLNILTQGNSLSLTLRLELGNIKKIAKEVKSCDRFIFSGAGDKYIIPSITKFIWDRFSRKPLDVYHSRVLSDYRLKLSGDTCVVFLTQSGTTKDTLDACKLCMKKGCKIIAITNLKGPSEKENIVDILEEYKNGHIIRTHTLLYPEDPLPSTNTFHTTLMVLNILALYVNQNKKLLDLHIKKLPTLVDKMSRDKKVIKWGKSTAKRIHGRNFIYVIGDGPRYHVADKQSKIMLMEGAKIDACAIRSEEFVHSIIETLEYQNRHLVLLKPHESWKEKNYDLIRKLWSSYSGREKLIICDPFIFLDEKSEKHFSGSIGNLASPFLYTILLEWQAFYLALLRKVDPGVGKLVSKIRSDDQVKKLIS